MWCSMCTHCMAIYSKYTMCPSEVKEQNLFEKFVEKKNLFLWCYCFYPFLCMHSNPLEIYIVHNMHIILFCKTVYVFNFNRMISQISHK